MSRSPLHALVARRTGSALSKLQIERLEAAAAPYRQGKAEHDFVAWLESDDGAEGLEAILTAIPVHKTDLFRDPDQLEVMRTQVLPMLLKQHGRLAVWSAGCATGEEVATLAVLLEEAGAHPASSVLGTDLSRRALEQAKALCYSAHAMRQVPESIARTYFERGERGWRLGPRLAARTRFEHHNLMDKPYPLPRGRAGFDLIVCRNVLIYFTEAAFEQVVESLTARLEPGGVLMLSAAEPIISRKVDLVPLRLEGASLYQKVPGSADRPGLTPTPVSRPAAPKPSAPAVTGASAPPRRTTTLEELKASRPPEPAPPPAADDPRAEAEAKFHQTLDAAAQGQDEAATEAGLRQALYLAPQLAPARYLLAVLLEQRGAKAEATQEFRRALAALKSGPGAMTSFFLNAARLETACEQALVRLAK